MSRKKLTAKQHAFLVYLQDYIHENSVWPTYREMIEEFGYTSPNSVTQNLQALYKKGFLRRTADGYQLIRHEIPAPPGIPVMGIIAAGQLQEAVEANLGNITLETLFPNLDRIFALRVSGQSMNGIDIHDGDYVLLINEEIPHGGIGAVLYRGETSLKQIFYSDGNGLRLEPANPKYETIHIAPEFFEEVRVLGRYVGHINKNGIHKRTTFARPVAA